MNYLEYYGLKEQPFSISVDQRFYYESRQHSEALLRLKHAAEERKGLALLVGEIGAGKTTLAQRLLDQLEEDRFESALLIVVHSSVTSEWLLRKIAVQMGVDAPSDKQTDLLGQFYSRLIEIHEKGRIPVVLVDEAQMLQSKVLMEEFRGLLNMEVDGQKLITFIFFGLPEIDQYLSLDEPLKQRVALRYYLQALTPEPTEDYVKYRLKIAGAEKEFFTVSAFSAIHQYSKGVPRLINIICDNALMEGFLRKKQRIDHDMIREIATDLNLPIE
jgi:general secretion pathway protein A